MDYGEHADMAMTRMRIFQKQSATVIPWQVLLAIQRGVAGCTPPPA